MKQSPPVYQRGSEQYLADSCQPLLAAAEAGQVSLDAVVHGHYPGVMLPDDVLPELCSAGSWNAPANQSWGLDWHRNEGIELTYLFSGQLSFAVDASNHKLQPGALTITRPWQRHRVGAPNIGASHLAWIILDVGVRRPNQSWHWPDWLILTEDERKRLSTLLRKNEQAVWKVGPLLENHFLKIEKIARGAQTKFDRTRMILAVNELLLAILELLDGLEIPLNDSLTSNERSVEMFLDELPKLIGEEWTVDSMAEHCGLKRSRFTSYCHQLTNRSPAQYLMYCRLSEAAKMLSENPGLTVTDIAHECGFSSSQHFATAFRQQHGKTPSQWREQ